MKILDARSSLLEIRSRFWRPQARFGGLEGGNWAWPRPRPARINECNAKLKEIGTPHAYLLTRGHTSYATRYRRKSTATNAKPTITKPHELRPQHKTARNQQRTRQRPPRFEGHTSYATPPLSRKTGPPPKTANLWLLWLKMHAFLMKIKNRGGCRQPPFLRWVKISHFWRRRPHGPCKCGLCRGHFGCPLFGSPLFALWRVGG